MHTDDDSTSSEIKTPYKMRFFNDDAERALNGRLETLRKPIVYENKKPSIGLCIFLLIFFIPGLLIYLGVIYGQNKYNQHQTNKENQAREAEAQDLEERMKRKKEDDFDSEPNSSHSKLGRSFGQRTSEDGSDIPLLPVDEKKKLTDEVLEDFSVDAAEEADTSSEESSSSGVFKVFK